MRLIPLIVENVTDNGLLGVGSNSISSNCGFDLGNYTESNSQISDMKKQILDLQRRVQLQQAELDNCTCQTRSRTHH